MADDRNSERLGAERPRTLGWFFLFGILLVFAIVVAWGTLSVREDIRSQLLDVDANVLGLLVRNEIDAVERDADLLFEFESLSESDIWKALLETTSVEGVFAIQLFDPSGSLVRSSSSSLLESSVPEVARPRLQEGLARSEFSRSVWLSDYVEVSYAADRRVAISDIYMPLKSSDGALSLGTARYLMDGSSLAIEFSKLDSRLMLQASVAVGLGGVAVFFLFWMARRRLNEANARVVRHANRLKRANAELAMLARTSAVGSVTAHLIHGLKNPLAGLRQMVNSRQSGLAPPGEEEWRGASDAAERMQRMVEEVIGVLQDASSGLSFEMLSGELFAELEARFGERAKRRGIAFSVAGSRDEAMDSSVGGIVLLVVSNLVQNALDATPDGGRVSVEYGVAGGWACLRVKDSGVGVPAEMRERLFAPVSSGKSGGAGIGLAISSQLARHLGGRLRLVDSLDCGAVFELRFPVREGLSETEFES